MTKVQIFFRFPLYDQHMFLKVQTVNLFLSSRKAPGRYKEYLCPDARNGDLQGCQTTFHQTRSVLIMVSKNWRQDWVNVQILIVLFQ